MSKNIVIIDIDGVLVKLDDYSKNIPTNPDEWEEYYKNVVDEPIEEMCRLVRALIPCQQVVFCTGRMETQRERTSSWIEKKVAFRASYLPLLMRKDGDKRCDTIVKINLVVEAGIDLNDIAFVLEDRSVMVKEWRRLGIRCLQVDEGNF